jgi:hypothetical protein
MANRKATADTIVNVTLTSSEAAVSMPLAAQAALEGKAEIQKGKAKGASALAVTIAALASDEISARPWTFDIMVKGDVHEHVQCTGFAEYGNEDLAWMRNGEGKVSRDAQGAYALAWHSEFFGLTEKNPAVRTMVNTAVPIARAVRDEGMEAAIEGGKLVLKGGTGERADAMRAAKSIEALKKIATGATGTSRATPQNSKGATGAGATGAGATGASDDKAVTPLELTRTALALAKLIAKGEAATCNAALENLRAIAALVDKHEAAFAGD